MADVTLCGLIYPSILDGGPHVNTFRRTTPAIWLKQTFPTINVSSVLTLLIESYDSYPSGSRHLPGGLRAGSVHNCRDALRRPGMWGPGEKGMHVGCRSHILLGLNVDLQPSCLKYNVHIVLAANW